jgi:hypothetical protein
MSDPATLNAPSPGESVVGSRQDDDRRRLRITSEASLWLLLWPIISDDLFAEAAARFQLPNH